MTKHRIKSVMMNVLFLIAGIAVGFIQFILLKKFTGELLSDGKISAVALLLKAILYIGFGVLIYFFMPYVIYMAAGYGVGIVASAAVNLIRRR